MACLEETYRPIVTTKGSIHIHWMFVDLTESPVAWNSIELSLIKPLEFPDSNPKPQTFHCTQLYSLRALVCVKLVSGT